MKLLAVVIDNGIGGIQNRILMVNGRLNKFGVDTVILTPNEEGLFSNNAEAEGFRVYQAFIGSPRFFSSLNNIFHNLIWFLLFPFSIFQIVILINREKIDIIHVNGLLALAPALAAKLTNKPLIWHLIGTLYPRSLVWVLRPIILWLSTYVVFVSRKTVDYYLSNNRRVEKVKFLYEPVDTDYFNINKVSENIKISIKKSLNIPEDCVIVGTICEISSIKGLEYFIQAAQRILQLTPRKLRFLIVGGTAKGHERYVSNLKRLVKDSNLDNYIIFSGYIPYPKIREMHAIIDIFIMTSLSEGTPLVILEAMSMSKPVIAPDVGGIAEQVIHNKTGFIFNAGDINRIVELILYLLEHPQEIILKGNNGRERVENFFSLYKCINDHLELYNEVKKIEDK